MPQEKIYFYTRTFFFGADKFCDNIIYNYKELTLYDEKNIFLH